MGKSRAALSFLISAGARLMVKRLIGVLNPELLTAAKIRSLLSLTALDAIPTIFTPKLSPEASHSTVS